MSKPPKTIKSEFAILDVLSKSELRKLQQALAKEPIRITIKGKLTCVYGRHDGTSQEYEVEVESVEVIE